MRQFRTCSNRKCGEVFDFKAGDYDVFGLCPACRFMTYRTFKWAFPIGVAFAGFVWGFVYAVAKLAVLLKIGQ